ncbi:MAG: hypothetical protein ACK2U3_09240 [Anaerolineales bacterium]|jgi:hypothetical protein
MVKSRIRVVILLFFVSILALPGCNGDSSEKAPTAVLDYLKALVEMDEVALINRSCADWEEDARLELKSFAAVKSSLENPDCQVTGEQDGYVLVNCTGKIIANYGAEDLEIDISKQTYRVLEEGGEWRMCGYR